MSLRDELRAAPPWSPGAQRAYRIAMSVVQGALLGAGMGYWEQVLLWTVGLDSLQGSLLQTVVLLYAATGAVCGGVVGLFGLVGPAWLLSTAGVLAGWWVSGKLGMAAAELGFSLWVGLLAVPLVGGVCVAAATLLEERVALGGAVALLLAVLVGLPVNLHLLGDPLSRLALLVDLVVVTVSIGLGALTAWLAGERSVVLGLMTGLAVSGWASAHNTTGPASVVWEGEASSQGPPIVLVMIDTLRADHLGSYGYHRVTSPHLDELARESVRFTRATAPASWTLPSTASLLTGAEPREHGAGVHDGQRNTRAPIAAQVSTLPELLIEGGYRTAGVVSNPWLLPPFGLHRGFDVYDAAMGPAPLPIGVHPLRVLGLDPTDWPAYRNATEMTEAALAHVEQRRDERGWFLFVHYMDVHPPHRPPEQDLRAVGGEPSFTQRYDASLHYVDRELGRLLKALPDSAVVVVTADHGEQITEQRPSLGPVPPGTRHGHTLYEELLHVPLLLRVPGEYAAVIHTPVGTIDVAPTLAKLAGLGWPEQERQGVLLQRAAHQSQRALRAEAPRYGPAQQSVRQGRYKLVRSAQQQQVFDLVADPAELQPLALPALEQRLAALLGPLDVVTDTSGPDVGAELQQMLDVLGYTEPVTPLGSSQAAEKEQPP